jgi:hypothetical protein
MKKLTVHKTMRSHDRSSPFHRITHKRCLPCTDAFHRALPRSRCVCYSSRSTIARLSPSQYSIKSRRSHLPDASVFRAGRPHYLLTICVTTAAHRPITAMPKLLSRPTKWFGLEVVHVVIIRRSRDGGLRFLHSTFPPDHHSVGVSRHLALPS